MDKQPEALRLADDIGALTKKFSEGWHEGIKIDATDIMDLGQADEELRRLHQVNQELVEVAEMAAAIGLHTLPDRPKCGCSQCDMVNAARAALAKHRGQA